MPSIRTVHASVRIELPRIKGSRFVGEVVPAPDEEGLRAAVAVRWARWPDATHVCWGWRGADDEGLSSDDGEPRGTAGEPILRRVVGADLHGVAVLVTRWYGGTKLGTGGLVRAYGEAAAAALAAAEVVEVPVTARVVLQYSYDLTGPVRGVLAAHGLDDADAAYGAEVTLALDVPVEAVDRVLADLTERTAGRITVVPVTG